jgi:hypothetical protein
MVQIQKLKINPGLCEIEVWFEGSLYYGAQRLTVGPLHRKIEKSFDCSSHVL